MKVILLQDVAKLGRRYDVVEVANGRAMNMLIPQGKAQAATDANIKKIKQASEKVAAEREAADKAFAAAVEKLEGEAVTVAAKANEKGHLFEALKEEAIAAALATKGVAVEAMQVLLAEPIKEVGAYDIALSNGGERHGVKLVVEAA